MKTSMFTIKQRMIFDRQDATTKNDFLGVNSELFLWEGKFEVRVDPAVLPERPGRGRSRAAEREEEPGDGEPGPRGQSPPT